MDTLSMVASSSPNNSQAPRERHTFLFRLLAWKFVRLVAVGVREDVGWAGGEKNLVLNPATANGELKPFDKALI